VHRPFRIPLGTAGCAVLLSFPVIATIAIIFVASYTTLTFSVAVNTVGFLLYGIGHYCKSWSWRRCCGYQKVDTSESTMAPESEGGAAA
jgi:hypothetical protein